MVDLSDGNSFGSRHDRQQKRMDRYDNHIDHTLVQRLRVGDMTAFETIYNNHVKELISFARKNVGLEVAEEMVQSVFVSLWERHSSLLVESIRAYLYQAVRYKIIRHVKHEKVRRKYEEHYRLFEAAYLNTPTADRNPDVLQAKIQTLITGLPERCRFALQLRLTENLSNTEIAERMHISKRTVESYMTTAFALLRDHRKDLLELS